MNSQGIRSRFARRAFTALTGATFVLGSAGAIALATTGPAHATHASAAAPSVMTGQSGDPYFICIAYAHQWGVCVGPPTN